MVQQKKRIKKIFKDYIITIEGLKLESDQKRKNDIIIDAKSKLEEDLDKIYNNNPFEKVLKIKKNEGEYYKNYRAAEKLSGLIDEIYEKRYNNLGLKPILEEKEGFYVNFRFKEIQN